MIKKQKIDFNGNEINIGDKVVLLETFQNWPKGTVAHVREYFGGKNKIILDLKTSENSYLGVPAEKVEKI